MSFSLPAHVKAKYADCKDPFGFNGLGLFVFRRTYSRIRDDGSNETWADTVERVINGCYSMQKDHVIEQGIGWEEEKAIKSATEMFDAMFNLRFTPPGRGLWAMGTKITNEKGIFAALNNCAFVSTCDIATDTSKPFRFLMDMSMLGVGCGFDVKGEDKITIRPPKVFKDIVLDRDDVVITYKDDPVKKDKVNAYIDMLRGYIAEKEAEINALDEEKQKSYVGASIRQVIDLYQSDIDYIRGINLRDLTIFAVKDTREGWVESVGNLLDVYFNGERVIVFDYSEIRPPGQLLKTFGGLSSGPEPLIELHIMIRRVMGKNIGSGITVRTIADVMNLIGKCVVAGNVRRSSEISLGPYESEEFMNLKNYAVNPDRMPYGWCSNNSVFGDVGMDYSEISKRIADNGEPGIIWMDNARGFSRMAEPRDDKDFRSMGTNPCCFAGDTLIAVADGRNAVSLRQLAEEGKDVPLWSYNRETMKPEIRWGVVPQRTGEDVEVMRVVLDDGSSITITPNHKMMLRNGEFIYARDLKVGDSLMRFDKVENEGYYKVSGADHREHSDETKRAIGDKTIERYQDPEYARKHKESYSEETRKVLSDKMKGQKADIDNQYYVEQERLAEEQGLITRWVVSPTSGNRVLKLIKPCETCKVEMVLDWRCRNTTFCSTACQNKDVNMINARKAGQTRYFSDKQQETRHNQIVAYNTVKTDLGRDPKKKEWEAHCRDNKISFRLRPTGGNEFSFRNYAEVKAAAVDYNHSVASIEILPTRMDVYNITVPDTHTISVITNADDDAARFSGIVVRNSEQTLESYELCCLVECYLGRHKSKEEFLRTLKFAYLYAKTVTLGGSHWVETNRVMKRNRRIGCSLTGIAQFLTNHSMEEFRQWCDEGYAEIQKWDEVYSDWYAIPRSIKTTSIKPSGCLPLDSRLIVNGRETTFADLFKQNGVVPSTPGWANVNGEYLIDDGAGGTELISRLFINGESDTYTVPLENGDSITCTAEHKWRVKTETGELIWVKTIDLVPGDDIVEM